MIEDQIEAGIVEPRDLFEHLQDGNLLNIKLVDASFVLPGSAENTYQNYHAKRIEHAEFFDIATISDPQSDLPHMLPSPDHFASAMSRLGLSNNDIIVVYGQSGMVMGPARAWWMFRVFGHEQVAVLNGGLPAWIKEGFEINTSQPDPAPKAKYIANFQEHLVVNIEAVKEATESHTLILDARASDRFSGDEQEPRSGMRAGHIPSAQNVPCMTLIDQNTGKLKSDDQLREIFESVGFKLGIDIITTCGSGITACVIALALYKINHKNTPVYDGSWSEWGNETCDTPIETGNTAS
ncbi:MAG: rhodanese-like domain-containing protein [Pseudomonadota bacterium]